MDLKKVKLFKKQVEQLEFSTNWRLKEELSCCGISLAQCQILIELGNKQEVCIVELSEALGVDSSTLSRTTNRMVEAGLVDRITNCSDRRYVSLSLSDKGKTLYQHIEERDTSYYAKVFEFIPERKREQVMESFNLFAEALKHSRE